MLLVCLTSMRLAIIMVMLDVIRDDGDGGDDDDYDEDDDDDDGDVYNLIMLRKCLVKALVEHQVWFIMPRENLS